MTTFSANWEPIRGAQYILSERKDIPKGYEVSLAKRHSLTIVITQDSDYWSFLNRNRYTMSPAEIDTHIVARVISGEDTVWKDELYDTQR